ncbi:MAG TPA: hypothetical protein ACFYDZ_00250 [Candidatus Brocadiaceae bacterium]
MSELKIDEDYLLEFAEGISLFIKRVLVDKNVICDKNADIFLRYMAFVRVYGYLEAHTTITQALQDAFCFGRSSCHEVFKTKMYGDLGWDNDKSIHDNPFFIQEEVCPEALKEADKLSEELKNFLKIVQDKKSTNETTH